MVKTKSTMLPLGTEAPGFSLPNVDGQLVSREEFIAAPALVVMFICNHCPYVIHIADHLALLGREYGKKGVGVVANKWSMKRKTGATRSPTSTMRINLSLRHIAPPVLPTSMFSMEKVSLPTVVSWMLADRKAVSLLLASTSAVQSMQPSMEHR